MKKINLTEIHRSALVSWGASGGTPVVAMKELFFQSISDLDSVSNIDAKGNVGLQTVAAQKAVEYLREMYEIIFPRGVVNVKTAPETGETRKPYR